MPKETDAKINRRLERQQELRELINGKKQLTQVIENIEGIEAYSVEVIEGEEIDYKAYQVADFNVKRLAKATELRLKLLNKTLPDLKAVENTLNTEDGSGKLVIEWQQ